MSTLIRGIFVFVVAACGMLPAQAQTRDDGSVMVTHERTTLKTGGKDVPAIKLRTVQGGHPLIYTEAPGKDCYLYVSKHRQPVMGDGQYDTFSRTMALLGEDNNNRARFRALWCTTDTMRVCLDYDGDPEHDTCTIAKWWKLTDKDKGTYTSQASQGTCPQDLSEIGMMSDAAFDGLERSGICDASVIAGMRAYRQQVNKEPTPQATEPPSSTAQVAEPSSDPKTIAPSQGAPANSANSNEAPAPGNDDRYSARICNDGELAEVYVAYAWRVRPSNSHRTLKGWFQIDPGRCWTPFKRQFGERSEELFYYHVRYGIDDELFEYHAGNEAIELCISNGELGRDLRGEYTCKSGEKLTPFGSIKLTLEKPHAEINVNPDDFFFEYYYYYQ